MAIEAKRWWIIRESGKPHFAFIAGKWWVFDGRSHGKGLSIKLAWKSYLDDKFFQKCEDDPYRFLGIKEPAKRWFW